MNQPSSDVEVICRLCGERAPSLQFKLDPLARAMVCPNCFGSKKPELKEEPSPQKEVISERPPGWDAEDEFLEREIRPEPKPKPNYKEVEGTDKCIIPCGSCKYEFKFNKRLLSPSVCPYCSWKVPLDDFGKMF